MGRYRLGDIIRMTRKSLSITQEQLSEKICSVETLSRIENGSQNPSRDTYELLMERMGRIRERAYSMLSVSDFKVLEMMKQFEECIKHFEYEEAESVLNEIKGILGESILDKQFLIRAESLVNYRLKRISIDEFLDGFQEAIRLTIPGYSTIPLSNWPLSFNEAMLLNNISIAYAEKGDYLKAISVMEEVYSAMKQSYMEEQQRVLFQVTLASNLAKWYGLTDSYEKAIAIANEGIDISREFNLGNVLPFLLYNVAWNTERLIEQGTLSPEMRNDCMKYMRRAYYIASAMQLSHIENLIQKHITENYGDTNIIK